jgi:hypothetical protein
MPPPGDGLSVPALTPRPLKPSAAPGWRSCCSLSLYPGCWVVWLLACGCWPLRGGRPGPSPDPMRQRWHCPMARTRCLHSTDHADAEQRTWLPAARNSLRRPGLLPCRDHGGLQPSGHHHRWVAPQRPAAVPLDQDAAGQPQDQLQRHLFCFQLCQGRQALPRRLLLSLQPAPLAGGDDRSDHQCGLLLYALQRTGSKGCEGLWAIMKWHR